MGRHVALIIVALTLVSCVRPLSKGNSAGSAFSFSECSLPSLVEINQNEYRVLVTNGVCRLTNAHPSFEESFDLLQDEQRNTFVVQDKIGRKMFEDNFDGVPRFVASMDLDADGDLDVIVELAAYGNHGNGTESFEVLLNGGGYFIRQRNSIAFEESCGQENKAGALKWYSAPNFCAIFEGEEADVLGDGTESSPIEATNLRTIREVWGHKDGSMRLLSKSSKPLEREVAHFLTFR